MKTPKMWIVVALLLAAAPAVYAQEVSCVLMGDGFEIYDFNVPEAGGAFTGIMTGSGLFMPADCESEISGTYDGVNLVINITNDHTCTGATQLCSDGGNWYDSWASTYNCVNGSCSGTITGNCGGTDDNPQSWNVYALNGSCVLTGDEDNDGVSDSIDECPDTQIPDSVPTRSLGTNRWALVNGDTTFDTKLPNGTGPGKAYTLEDTHGCSCEQIIEELELGTGHTKYGCSSGVMDAWVALMNESEDYDPSCDDSAPAAEGAKSAAVR